MLMRRSNLGTSGRTMGQRLTLNAYRRRYRLRAAVSGRNCLQVTFPYEVLEREARTGGLSVGEFIHQFQAVAHYDGFDSVYYTLESVPPREDKLTEKRGEK